MKLYRILPIIIVFAACGSDTSEPVPQAPAAPTDVLTSARTGEITVTWKDVTGETGYKVEYREEGSENWTLLVQTAENVTSAVHTNVSHGVQYHYRIAACNAVGCSGHAMTSGKWQATGAPPLLLTATISSIGGTRATLAASARSGGLPTRFDFALHKGSTATPPVWVSDPTWETPTPIGNFEAVVNAHVNVTNLQPGTDYVMTVTARNGSGASPEIAPVAFKTIPIVAPTISQRVQARGAQGYFQFWANVSAGGADTEYTFQLARIGDSFDTPLNSESGTTPADRVDWPARAIFMGAVAQPGVTYKWRVVARNSVGTTLSDSMVFTQ